jgi:hypothetical protein
MRYDVPLTSSRGNDFAGKSGFNTKGRAKSTQTNKAFDDKPGSKSRLAAQFAFCTHVNWVKYKQPSLTGAIQYIRDMGRSEPVKYVKCIVSPI